MTRALGLLCAAVLAAGCGGDDDAMTVDWDLTGSHRLADVDWPKPELTATSFAPEGDEVRLRLPGDTTFTTPADDVHDVTMRRDGDTVIMVSLDSPRLGAEEAKALARRWAEPFGLPTGRLEGDPADVILRRDDPLAGPDGPAVNIEVRDPNFPTEYIVALQLLWDEPDAGAPPAP